jgi:hypothetical protein
MAALQLGEEIREIHGEALPWFDMYIFATGAGKGTLLSRLIQILKSDAPSPMLQRWMTAHPITASTSHKKNRVEIFAPNF